MSRQTVRVTFQPEGRAVFVLAGTTLVEAAGQAGIVLSQPCGGEGTCGKCRVEVLENAPEPTDADRRHLSPSELAAGWRLACQLSVGADLVVSVPQETRFFEQMILSEGESCQYPFQPILRKQLIDVPPASIEDQRSDLDRLKAAIGNGALRADLSLIRALPGLLRSGPQPLTAVLEGDEIQWLEPGDTTGGLWGIAFDIGTTSVVGTLMDLTDGSSRCVASRTNPQVHFGDDVVTRIGFAERTPDGLDRLRKRLLTGLNEIIEEVCDTAQIEPEAVYEVVAVGNTTMSHIFLGIDPSPIAHAPYVAVCRGAVDLKAVEAGLEVNGNANLHVLPNIAGFVGSDTVAVVLASGMALRDEPTLAIDIGTNGEVVVGNRRRLIACSCAAGPAFEGARIRHGMRATDGAVSKVVLNAGIEVGVIGGGRAAGICGSGLVDAVAELLSAGVIDETGRIADPQSAAHLPDRLRRAILEFEGQPAVVLVEAADSRTGQPVLLTQKDVREVQLAKAAVHAGIEVVCRELGLDPREVPRVLMAGGFGTFIRRSQAQRIGLLPAVPTDRIESIGNAAAAGAKVVLACTKCRAEAERISRETEYVELAARPDFQTAYMEAMTFPPRA